MPNVARSRDGVGHLPGTGRWGSGIKVEDPEDPRARVRERKFRDRTGRARDVLCKMLTGNIVALREPNSVNRVTYVLMPQV